LLLVVAAIAAAVIVLAVFLLRNELSIHVEIENVIKHLFFALGQETHFA